MTASILWAPKTAHAEGIISSQLADIKTTFVSGDWDVYLTGYVWHLPWQYDSAERHLLNERNWGGGFGRSYTSKRGDKSALFIMAFTDCHYDIQYSGGYMWHRYWTVTKGLDAGLGYSIFLFSRADVAHHWPIPAALPSVALRFGRGELLGFYCPHISEAIPGEVFFIFARVKL